MNETNPFSSPTPENPTPVEPATPPNIPNTMVLGQDCADHSTGLVVFGIGQILMGGLCGLLAVGVVFGAAVMQGQGMGMSQVLPIAVLYVVGGVMLAWLGIGSIQARRWAWALSLIFAWLCLVGGTLALVAVAFVMPSTLAGMGMGDMSGGMGIAFLIAMLAFTSLLYVALPGAYVLFYRSKNTEMTCRIRDPQERWTDRCPLSVLAVSVVYALAAASLLGTLGSAALPCFGTYVTGLAGAILAILLALIAVFLAWAIYHRKPFAWWTAAILLVVGSASTMVTGMIADPMEAYARSGMTEQQIEMMANMPILPYLTVAFSILYLVIGLAYLVKIRHHFLGERGDEAY